MWNLSLCVVVSFINVHIIDFVGIGEKPQYQEGQPSVCCLIIKKSAIIEQGKGKETAKEPMKKRPSTKWR